MSVDLTEEQRRQVVRLVVERVAGRLAAPPAIADGVMPCAIPPPGSPRHEAVMRALDEREAAPAKKPCGCGCKGRPSSIPACRALAPFIDHSSLKPDATPREIERLCHEAVQYGFKGVCVNGAHVALAAGLLQGTPIKVCATVGFPLGSMTPEAKAFEARDAVIRGAGEIDMVINIGRLRAGDYEAVLKDIRAVIDAAAGRRVKVILECALLADEEKIAACAIAKKAGAHFVKTSTGFGKSGATPEDVALLRRCVGEEMGVKAAGGIRDCASAQAMIAAGASRIGTSASLAIIQG